MTPLEKIKHGILEKNIDLIAEGYQEMTGDQITSQKKRGRPKGTSTKPSTTTDINTIKKIALEAESAIAQIQSKLKKPPRRDGSVIKHKPVFVSGKIDKTEQSINEELMNEIAVVKTGIKRNPKPTKFKLSKKEEKELLKDVESDTE